VLVRNVKSGEMTPLTVAGVFMFVGTQPHLDFLEGLLERREGGWLATDRNLATSVPGIFAAGDVRDTPLRQVVTAAADGALAAMSAYHYLDSHR
jgi:thioredoxin reductase (NADPH)